MFFCVCQCVWYLLIKILKQSTNVMERLKEKYNILILSVCALVDLGNWGNILIELLIEVSFSLASLIATYVNEWLTSTQCDKNTNFAQKNIIVQNDQTATPG